MFDTLTGDYRPWSYGSSEVMDEQEADARAMGEAEYEPDDEDLHGTPMCRCRDCRESAIQAQEDSRHEPSTCPQCSCPLSWGSCGQCGWEYVESAEAEQDADEFAVGASCPWPLPY